MATVTDTTTDTNGNIIINVSSSTDDAITLATAGTYSDKNIIFNVTTPYTPTDLPLVTSSDSGKFLRVSSAGKWVAETIPNASGVSF